MIWRRDAPTGTREDVGATELPDRYLPADTLVYLTAAAGDDGREWRAVVVSQREEDFVVRLQGGSPGEALPDELWAVAVTSYGPARFRTRVLERADATLSCLAPRDLEFAERREFFRVPVAFPLTLSGEFFHKFRTTSLDLGPGGMQAHLPDRVEALDPGVLLDVAIDVGEIQPLSNRGITTYRRTTELSRAVGVKFVQIEPAFANRLTRILGQCQRRLLPRVELEAEAFYRALGESEPLSAAILAAVSPGALTLIVPDKIPLAGRVHLNLTLDHREFELQGTPVRIEPTTSASYRLEVALDEVDPAPESRFRIAVRNLAEESTTA